MQCRSEVAAELRKLGLGCMVLQLHTSAACWLCDDAPEASTSEAQKLLYRLVKYHHLPEECISPPIEMEGSESLAFWEMLRPQQSPQKALTTSQGGGGAGRSSLSPDKNALDAISEAVRDVSMQDARGDVSASPMPPTTCTRARANEKRGFGGFGPPTHALLGSAPPAPPTQGGTRMVSMESTETATVAVCRTSTQRPAVEVAPCMAVDILGGPPRRPPRMWGLRRSSSRCCPG